MPAPTMNTAPLTISFTNTSSGDNLSYNWNFGDGQTSTLQNPTHTFQAGAWEVTLTVTNELALTAIFPNSIVKGLELVAVR